MKAVVDRIENSIENKIAVLLFESQKIYVNVPLVLLPPGTKEGDWLTVSFRFDGNKTSDMYQKNQALLEKLKRK